MNFRSTKNSGTVYYLNQKLYIILHDLYTSKFFRMLVVIRNLSRTNFQGNNIKKRCSTENNSAL